MSGLQNLRKTQSDMEAPDKICVAPHQISVYDLDIQSVGHNGAEEYIRKDALLEWAKERYKSTISNIGCYTGHSVWAEVIEHINEM